MLNKNRIIKSTIFCSEIEGFWSPTKSRVIKTVSCGRIVLKLRLGTPPQCFVTWRFSRSALRRRVASLISTVLYHLWNSWKGVGYRFQSGPVKLQWTENVQNVSRKLMRVKRLHVISKTCLQMSTHPQQIMFYVSPIQICLCYVQIFTSTFWRSCFLFFFLSFLGMSGTIGRVLGAFQSGQLVDNSNLNLQAQL